MTFEHLAYGLGHGFLEGCLQLQELSFAAKRCPGPSECAALVTTFNAAPTAALSNLRVLRFHKFFDMAGPLINAFCRGSPQDGRRWERLRVLSFQDTLLGDDCLQMLARRIKYGCFGVALEELDFSVSEQFAGTTKRNTFHESGLHALRKALKQRRGTLQLKCLKLGGQRVGDDGGSELLWGSRALFYTPWRSCSCGGNALR